jgi:hypothetical protein
VALRAARCSVPLAYRPGDQAEVDFVEVLVDVNGLRFHIANDRLPVSVQPPVTASHGETR